MFLCRDNELKILNRHYSKNTLECIVIYGRRRVGKTALINEFSKDKPTIYFLALNAGPADNLAALSKSLYLYQNPDARESPVYPSFDAVFSGAYLYYAL